MSLLASLSLPRRSEYFGKGIPYPLNSASSHPAPSPKTKRPPDIWSIVVLIFATIDGCLNRLHETNVPRVIWDVRTAKPLIAVQGSKMEYGMRWSEIQAEWYPRPSADCVMWAVFLKSAFLYDGIKMEPADFKKTAHITQSAEGLGYH